MNLKHLPNTLLTATAALTIILSGITTPSAASDHGNHRSPSRHTEYRSGQSRKKGNGIRTAVKKAHHKGTLVKTRTHRPDKTPIVRNHSHHQKHKNVVRVLPRGHKTYRHGKHHYYCHNGHFYRHHNHGYIRISAPRFYYLPHHARRIIINGHVYFLCDNVYYRYHNGYYEMCEAPCRTSSITFGAWPFSITLTDDHY